MSLTIKSLGPFGCLDPTLKLLSVFENTREQVLPLPLHSYVVGYATFCADPQYSRMSLARSIATSGPVAASAWLHKWTGGQRPMLGVNEDVLPG